MLAPATAAELGWLRALFLSMVLGLSWSFQHGFERWGLVDDVFRQPLPFAGLFHITAASEPVLRGVLWAWRGALLLGAAGIFTRWSTVASAALGAYVLALPHTFGKVNHNDATVLVGLFIMALAPSGEGWSVDALIRYRLSDDSPTHTGTEP